MLELVKRDSRSLPLPQETLPPVARWFSARGSVIRRGDVTEVFVGGTLVGSFDEDQPFERNAILVQLAEDPRCHLTRLAEAFEVSRERLRQLRHLYEQGGLEALRPGEAGGPRKLSERDVVRLEKMFAAGMKSREAQGKFKKASLSTVSRAYRAWRDAKAPKVSRAAPAESPEAKTLALPGIDMLPTSASVTADEALVADDVRGGPAVQHVGCWLMLGMLEAFGFYDVVRERAARDLPWDQVRVGLDATVASFAIGEHTLEGARRLRTPTAKLLLRSASVPSPDGLRELTDELAKDHGDIAVQLGMVRRYLAADRALAAEERGVFYVDNHLRPYTGKHVVRKGWRMQDKRVRPGVSDYYVHDEDGRPLFRLDAPAHDSLPMWLLPIVDELRLLVGDEDRVLVAFDRGGAFPRTMATLREKCCEFVTYERGPYRTLPASAFTSSVLLDDDDGVPTRFVEVRANLGKGRGRVRRIAVLAEDGRQVNILASSTLPAERLIEIMRGRWRQENAFKHGKERWGINHLDARKVEPVPPDDIMPNPARRRLDLARRAAHVREGDARCTIADHAPEDARHLRALESLAEAVDAKRAIDALRPSVPRHARVADTELAGKLVRHDGRRKRLLDAVRIACANAESDLAQMLAAHLPKPREAKRTLATIFRSPGRVRVGLTTISVDLAPPATRSEGIAIAAFLRAVSTLDLTLPGDPNRRRLRFRAQVA